ncbi:MAG: plasmid stabilization protein [Acidimicrobiales bacterium]|nr:MAG: plasmid stabilization protein [Acidimicrobiales bacterium]
MATITVRNLEAEVQRRIKHQAASHGQSMEAEARAILTAAVIDGGFAAAWLNSAADVRGDDLVIPTRSVPRESGFS